MIEPKDRSDRWLVVGAGPSGLSVSLALRRAGVDFEGVEAGATVGGMWNMDNPGGAMYTSAHFISSAARSGWADLPMPEHYPDYPRWWEIRDYIHGWAAHHDLARHYTFGTRVEQAVPVRIGTSVNGEFGDETSTAGNRVNSECGDETSSGNRVIGECWDVTLSDGEVRRYRGLVACPGFQRVPNVPTYPGSFSGEARHSQTYKLSAEFEGKRVMVVGAGNSAVDIAVDAAIAADRAVISTRRAYWFFPKLIGGVPLDCFAINSVSSQTRLRRFLEIHVGDVGRVGFGTPDHAPLAHHPILNDQILHHLAHGNLVSRPEIERFDGDTVSFVDGTTEELDLVIWATGYLDRVPFVADEHCRISSDDADNDLFIWMFHRRHPQMMVLGPANLAAGGYWGLAASADLIANHIRDQQHNPERWQRMRAIVESPEPDLSSGYSYYQKPGHLNYVNAAALDRYSTALATELGYEPLAHPADFEPPELVDIDDWLDNPRPLAMPSHGSLTPIPYQPRDLTDD